MTGNVPMETTTHRSPSRRIAAIATAVFAATLAPQAMVAQFVRPPAPAAYTLTDATVVHADGRRESGVTIVVRRGRIEALGPGIEPPPDAQVLDGDSLHVYPGLVDAWGNARYEFPEPEVEPSELASWAPPRESQGFTPHRRVADYLAADGSMVEDLRKKGVVAMAVHPTGPVLPGRGAFLVLRKSAAVPHQLIADEELGPVMSLQGAEGVYPATLFAVIAFYRQAFEDARHRAAHMAAYSRDPGAVRVPAWDPDLQVLQAAAAGEVRVFFAADLARDIRRAIEMSSEFGIRPAILGGEEAWKVADALRAAEVPVLVSLDFPEPERWKPEEAGPDGSEEADAPGEPGEGAEPGTDPEEAAAQEPLDAAAEREKRRLEDIYANAGRLVAEGVTVALTGGGGRADLREGARKAIEYGLDEAAALRALTATPAGLFGMPHLARLERGGGATFVVTDGPLFDEDTKVLYTFVEGEIEEGSEDAGPTEEPTVDVTGTWSLSIDATQGRFTGTAELEQSGADVDGRVTTEFGDARVRSGIVSGNEVSFRVVFEVGGERIRVDFTGTVEGDRVSGTGRSPEGSLRWSGERTSVPENEEA